jgi:hypothetical protein
MTNGNDRSYCFYHIVSLQSSFGNIVIQAAPLTLARSFAYAKAHCKSFQFPCCHLENNITCNVPCTSEHWTKLHTLVVQITWVGSKAHILKYHKRMLKSERLSHNLPWYVVDIMVWLSPSICVKYYPKHVLSPQGKIINRSNSNVLSFVWP